MRDSEIQQNSSFVNRLDVPTLVIGFLGFFVSLYALAIHILDLIQPGSGQLCDINATVSCSSVINSGYGSLASIPLGAYGMAYFAIVLAAAFLPKITQTTRAWLARWELLVALIGVVVVAVLAFISYSVLQILCPACSTVHVLVVVYALLKGFQFYRLSRNKKTQAAASASSETTSRFFAVALCVALPPLVAGFIVPLVAVRYFKQPTAETKASATAKPANEPALASSQSSLFSPPVNKTNYVGNGEDYRRGDDNAPVVIQMFSDFGCPHCRSATQILTAAQDRMGLQNVLFVYRFFPLSNKCNPYVKSPGWYPYTCELSEAARCAGQQGKFWEFKSWAFSGQSWTDEERNTRFSKEGLNKEATQLGLSVPEFSACLQNHTELQKIRDDAQLGNSVGLNGTPLIFINGVKYDGPMTVQAFIELFSTTLAGSRP